MGTALLLLLISTSRCVLPQHPEAVLKHFLLQKETFTLMGGWQKELSEAQTAFHSLTPAEDLKDKSTSNHTQSAGRNEPAK